MHHVRILILTGIALVLLFTGACTSSPITPPVPPLSASETNSTEPSGSLRMALIPVLDVLPFFIAEELDYFEAEGLNVEFVAASSALEREQLLIAGDVDGMLTDVIGPAIMNAANEGIQVRIVAMARRAYNDAPLFRLLLSPTSSATTPSDLIGIPIGVSENSVIQYLGDRLLEANGLAQVDIVFESVPSIPTRLVLLMEGSLSAAILPDPLASAAIEAGAISLIDDTLFVEQQYSQSVLSFSATVLEERPEDVRAFLRAWYRAVQDLNANPNTYRQLLLENTSVPESVQDSYSIPPFPVGEITSEAVWDDVNTWLVARGIIAQAALYADSVDASFLP